MLAVPRIIRCHLVMACCLCLLTVGWCVPSLGSEQQTRFFEQLRSRELYGLIERFCLEELNRSDLPPYQRIQLSSELSKTYGQHALVVAREQQVEMWQRARQVLDDAKSSVGQHERTLLLDLQAGFIPCAQGQAIKWELNLTPEDIALRKQALSLLSEGIEQLSRLEPVIREKILHPSRKEIPLRDKFTSGELRDQLGVLQFELGQAYYVRAGLLDAGDADRFSAVDSAEKWLGAAIGSDRISEFAQTGQILLAGCARLKIDAQRASRMLEQVEKSMPSQTVADLVLAERARLLLMQKRPTDAAKLLTDALKQRQPAPGELIALRVEVLIELWRTATEKGSQVLAKEIDAELDRQVESLTAAQSNYWAAYCETLISTARDARSLGEDLADLVRRARGLYAAKQIPEAISAYANASRNAAKSGKADLAFDMAYTRGSIEVESGKFADAVETFTDLVELDPSNPRTADALFLAAYALGQIYYELPSKVNREAYVAALESQRQNFPEHATFGEATWLLAQLEERRLQNSSAIRLYQEVPADHPRAGQAGAATARCYDLVITRLRDLKQPTDQWEAEAEEKLTVLLPTEKRRVRLPIEQATLALHLANIYLQSKEPPFAKADQLLEWILRSAQIQLVPATPVNALGKAGSKRPASDALRDPAETKDEENSESTEGDATVAVLQRWLELQRVAMRLRVVSLAGQGRLADAEQSLVDLEETSPSELLAIISGLSKLVSQAQEKPRHELGELQLRAALRLGKQRAQLSPAEQQRLDRCIVEAYVAAGRYPEAVDVYRGILASRPKDVEILTGLAQLLMKFGQRAKTEEAQALWKKLDGLTKAGTDPWFEVRLNYAQCDLTLGKPDQALKLLRVTKVMYAEPKDATLKEQLQRIEKECEAAVKK